MPNTTHTNRLTSLVALRFAENSNYLKTLVKMKLIILLEPSLLKY